MVDDLNGSQRQPRLASPILLGLLGVLLAIAVVYLILGYQTQASRFAMAAAVAFVISAIAYIASRHFGTKNQEALPEPGAALAQGRRVYTVVSVVVAALGAIGVVLGVSTDNPGLTVYSWGAVAFGSGFGAYAFLYTNAQIRRDKRSQA